MTGPVASVRDLRIQFGSYVAVDGLSFDVAPGSALGIVGESGSGKTVTAQALLGLHRGTQATVSGDVTVAGVRVLSAPMDDIRQLRGARASMIFQDPLSALDPYYRIGDQIAEVYRVHTGASRREARERAVEVLDQVHIPEPSRRVDSFPHELSGGMRQRALIAMALACRPHLLIADEPTTALDVTVQAQILDLLAELRERTGMTLVLVTHDIGVIADSVDDVLVLRRGREVEAGPIDTVLRAPREPYTQALLDAVPRLDTPRPPRTTVEQPEQTVLEARHVHRHFTGHSRGWRRAGRVRAVVDVDLALGKGETLGIVGESGSGKTTLARMLVGLLPPSSGSIVTGGTDLATLSGRRLRAHRRAVQMVFQDPGSSLNPRRAIGESVAEPLRVRGFSAPDRAAHVRDLLRRVGLEPERASAYPHEFSGGQLQRIALARALAAQPGVLVCDEPVSALDVTTQAQVLELLADLRDDLGLSVVFVSHDLAVVRQVSDRIAVMRAGEIVELATVDELYENPQHQYTKALLAAVPVPDPRLARQMRAERLALKRDMEGAR